MTHYLVLSGTGSEFDVQLRKPIDLTLGNWRVAMFSIALEDYQSIKQEEHKEKKRIGQPLYIYSNLCEPRLIGDTVLPHLDTIFINIHNDSGGLLQYSPLHPSFVSTVRETLNHVHIRLCTEDGSPFPIPNTCKVFMKLYLEK